MSSGAQDVKQESTFKPSREQSEIIQYALPYIKQFSQNPPPPPSGTSIAPFNAVQKSAQENILGAIPGLADYGQAAAQGNRFLFSGDVLRPESNPALQGTIEAATRPIIENATQNLLPAVRSGAVASGQYGGSRQGLAEGKVAEATQRQVGDTAAQIANQGYQTGLDAMTRGLALAPQSGQGLISPYITQGSVGDVQRQLTQAQTSEAYNQQQIANMWPALLAQEILGQSASLPGGTNASQGTQPGPSLFNQVLGGVSAIGSLLPLFGFL